MFYSGSQTYWARLSKHSIVGVIKTVWSGGGKDQVGLILGWYFTRGDLENKLLRKNMVGFSEDPGKSHFPTKLLRHRWDSEQKQ